MSKALVYSDILSFSVGIKQSRASRIHPIFLPFAGCPQRCVFCAQDKQTGVNHSDEKKNLFQILQSAHNFLACYTSQSDLCDDKKTGHTLSQGIYNSTITASLPQNLAKLPELAFYGGTFTALPLTLLQQCLNFYHAMRTQGLVSCCRCSTRPDAVSRGTLMLLQQAGLDLVELGVQSYDEDALRISQRGYNAKQAWQGCQSVKEAGLKLGIQLLPGMPGVTPAIFLRDVEAALQCQPDCLRFYPCLVPEGTPLADTWRRKQYQPWSLEETVTTLAQGLQMAWQAGVPVLRLSVAPEASFDNVVIAGPRHPALGSMIQAEALLRTVESLLPKFPHSEPLLCLPRSCQGYLYGQGGVLRRRWAKLGFTSDRIHFTAEPVASLCAE